MEREILFRAQRVDNNEWVEGYYYHDQRFIDGMSCQDVYLIRNDIDEDYFIKKNTVCQFTGLTDKNGTKIFEGDILESNYGSLFVCAFFKNEGYVIIHEQTCRYEVETKPKYDKFDKDCIDIYDLNIVDNIFDSPELLK